MVAGGDHAFTSTSVMGTARSPDLKYPRDIDSVTPRQHVETVVRGELSKPGDNTER